MVALNLQLKIKWNLREANHKCSALKKVLRHTLDQ